MSRDQLFRSSITSPDNAGADTQPLHGIHILLVEDSADARDVMEILLTGAGAKVTMKADGATALEWLSTQTADVIVSDIGMPGMDGWELLRRLRSHPASPAASVPAVALTAHVTPADRERSRAAGFQEHLPKPVDIDELFRVITRLAPSR